MISMVQVTGLVHTDRSECSTKLGVHQNEPAYEEKLILWTVSGAEVNISYLILLVSFGGLVVLKFVLDWLIITNEQNSLAT